MKFRITLFVNNIIFLKVRIIATAIHFLSMYQTCIPVDSNPESVYSETHSISPDCSTVDSDKDFQDLQDLIKHKVASLLLLMQTPIHVSKATTQEIVNELCKVYSIVY